MKEIIVTALFLGLFAKVVLGMFKLLFKSLSNKQQTEPQQTETLPNLSPSHLFSLRGKNQFDNKPTRESILSFSDSKLNLKILPAFPEDALQTRTWYAHKFKHGVFDERNRLSKFVFCTATENANTCHFCELYSEKQKDAENASNDKERRTIYDAARNIKKLSRYYYNVVVFDERGYGKQPVIFSAGKLLHSKIFEAVKEYSDVLSLDSSSCNLQIRRTDCSYRGFATYDVVVKDSPAFKAEDAERWMANLWDLDSVISECEWMANK